jgi:acyl carrier protein
MSTDIRTSLKAFLTAEILHDPGYPLTDDEPLISSGLIDSFSLVDIALWVEKNFGIRIEDNELTADNFNSVNEFVAHIEARR